MVRLNNVSKSFKNKKIIGDICFSFEENSIYCIIGKNGVGKTTLLKLILKLLKCDSGEIVNYGLVSGLIENASGYKGLSVIEYLKYLLPKNNYKHIDKYANLFNISQYLNKPFEKISLGTKQKVMLTYIFSLECDVIVLDEPTISLDSDSCNIFFDILKEEREKGKTIIMTTNDLSVLNMIPNMINLELKNGKLYSFLEKQMKIRIHCVNEIIKDVLEKNNVIYEKHEKDYFINCNDLFLKYLLENRSVYEISEISFDSYE